MEKDEKYSKYTVGDLVKYWGHFKPNELGRLLIKHGLGEKLKLGKDISGTLEIQKSESGGWLWKKKGATFFKRYNPQGDD